MGPHSGGVAGKVAEEPGKGGREVKVGKVLMAKVGSMSSGTCTCEVRAESVRNQDT